MKKVVKKLLIISSLFIVGSLIGFAFENVLTIFKGKEVLRKGLIYSPLIPVYGAGLLLLFGVYSKINFKKKNIINEIIIIFILGFILGGITEYLFSYLQEKIFGTISWDYSYLKYNFDGRTSIFHMCIWGLLSVIFYELILPILKKGIKLLDNKIIRLILIIISIFVLLDIIISTVACLRREERRNNIMPNNKVEELLDKYYPDNYIDSIFNNAKVVK